MDDVTPCWHAGRTHAGAVANKAHSLGEHSSLASQEINTFFFLLRHNKEIVRIFTISFNLDSNLNSNLASNLGSESRFKPVAFWVRIQLNSSSTPR